MRDAFPDTPLIVICSTATAPLYSGTFANIRTIPVPRDLANGLRGLGRLPGILAQTGLRGCAAALLSNDEPSLAALAGFFAARRRVGFDQMPAKLRWALSDALPVGGGRNVVDINFDLVRRLTGDTALAPRRTPIGFTDQDRAVVAGKLRTLGLRDGDAFALLHPFGKKRYQMWGVDKYKALGDEFERQGLPAVFLSGGPAERIDGVKVASGLSVNQVAALCKAARLFVGSNSGPMHMSAAMGTPTAAVQGATAREWDILWPDTPHVHIVATDVPCVPCERFGQVTMDCTNEAAPMACMTGLSVDHVFRAAWRLVESSEPKRPERTVGP